MLTPSVFTTNRLYCLGVFDNRHWADSYCIQCFAMLCQSWGRCKTETGSTNTGAMNSAKIFCKFCLNPEILQINLVLKYHHNRLFILKISAFFQDITRIGRLPQGKQPTFSDTLLHLSWLLVDQSSSGSCLSMGIGASFWWPFFASRSISCRLGKRCWKSLQH